MMLSWGNRCSVMIVFWTWYAQCFALYRFLITNSPSVKSEYINIFFFVLFLSSSPTINDINIKYCEYWSNILWPHSIFKMKSITVEYTLNGAKSSALLLWQSRLSIPLPTMMTAKSKKNVRDEWRIYCHMRSRVIDSVRYSRYLLSISLVHNFSNFDIEWNGKFSLQHAFQPCVLWLSMNSSPYRPQTFDGHSCGEGCCIRMSSQFSQLNVSNECRIRTVNQNIK